MEEIDIIKKLSGHSGCDITLIRKSNSFLVRKVSSSESYNTRLKAQCIKQIEKGKLNFNVPKIYYFGIDNNNLFYFDMEYINSYSLAKILPTLSYDEIRKTITELISKLDFDKKTSEDTNKTVKIKTKDVFNKINNKKEIDLNLLNKALSIVDQTDFSDMPLSSCHGDLTLENVLFTNHKLYFIDFLDSYVESWIVDIAKILQDLELHWAYRNIKMDANIELRTLIAKEKVIEEVKRHTNNSNKILRYVYIMLLINVMRIYPYSSDKKDLDFLNRSLKNLIDMLTK